MNDLESGFEFSVLSEVTEKRRQQILWGDSSFMAQGHEERIALLTGIAAVDFSRKLLCKAPGYSAAAVSNFENQDTIKTDGDVSESDEEVESRIRRWLYDKGVPFSCTVYLVQHERVIRTEWKIFLKYFPFFTNYFYRDMVILDATKQWVFSLNHEGFITFYCH
jgi:hypothetical protein